MTCKEKLRIEHPDLVSSPVGKYIAGCCGCPDDYGYAKRPEYCNDGDKTLSGLLYSCCKCWNRPVEEI